MMLDLGELACGDRVRLMDFGSTGVAYRRKLLSLGVTRGVEMTVIRKAPLGCPVQVEVRGTALTLRKNEADHLRWEKI